MDTKIEMNVRPRQDFKQENQDMIDKMKHQMEKPVTPVAQQPVTMVIEPNDTVMFNGKKATVLSTWPDNDDVILMVDGMTVECSKKQCKIIGRTDTMECPMKFKDGIPVCESKSEEYDPYVRVNFGYMMNETYYVNFNEWQRKKGKQKVKVLNESMENVTGVPKESISVLELPDGMIGKDDGYVPGVIIASDGGAEQKVMIKADEYATSTNDADMIHILLTTADGYQDGKMPKSSLKTLSV